jgi:hypothetical protein
MAFFPEDKSFFQKIGIRVHDVFIPPVDPKGSREGSGIGDTDSVS